MKKVNKARKITENDIRNLHYIHENEGLIPDGVTRLEDEDITSAEVITENKKSKVNEDLDWRPLIHGSSERLDTFFKQFAPYLLTMDEFYNKCWDRTTCDKIIAKINDYVNDPYVDDLNDYQIEGLIAELREIILSAEDLVDMQGNHIFESETIYNIDFSVDKKDPNYTKEEANSILRMLGYQADPSQVDLEEIIRHFDIDYNGDSDYEEYIVTLLGYYYLMFGRTEFYKDYAHKYGTAVNENEDDMDEFKKLADSDVWKEFRKDWNGTDVYDVAMEAISYVDKLPEMINVFKKVLTEYDMLVDYEDDLDKLLGQQTVNEGEFEKFMYMNNIDSNIVNDKEAFENKIQYFVDQDRNDEFHEAILLMLNAYKKQYGETDFYRNLVNQGYSLDDLRHEGRLRFFCQKYLKENGFDSNSLNSQSSLKDSIQNMVNNNKDYNQICALLNYYKEHYGMDDFVRSLTDKNNDDPFGDGNYYDIDSYGKFETINEYKTVGVYEPNNGEVEDLYYIQAGDIILIHHKDYGELQCKVKKVDADKNKVYFVTIERGIMGVCGFDKIHGIELVDECQKQPIFVQTKHIKFPEGGMCYMCYSKVGSRFVDIYCTFGMSLDNCECIKLLNMSEDEFGIIDNIMAESDTMDDAKNRVYNSGLISL